MTRNRLWEKVMFSYLDTVRHEGNKYMEQVVAKANHLPRGLEMAHQGHLRSVS